MKLSEADQELIKAKFPTFDLDIWNDWLRYLEEGHPEYRYWLWADEADWDEDTGPYIIDGLDIDDWNSEVKSFIEMLSDANFRTEMQIYYLENQMLVPDYDYWGKLAVWSDAEFLLLSQLIDPEQWSKIPTCLASADMIRPMFHKSRLLLKSHVDNGRFELHRSPSDYVAWAEQYEIDLPQEMRRAIRPISEACSSWNHQELVKKIENLENEIIRIVSLYKDPNDNSVQMKKLYIILIAMAFDKYGYVGQRNAAAKQIVGSVECLSSNVDPADGASIRVDEDSVRSHLKRAVDALGISVPPKSV